MCKIQTRYVGKLSSLKNQPLVTVITVVYNGVNTIKNTIESVINQTYPNLEYLIIDGGSTDGTLEIIKQYDDKISCWTSEPDKGIYDAMNKGLSRAHGVWINFMNSGDSFYNNNVIQKIFSRNLTDEVSIVYGIPVNNKGEKIKQYKLSKVNLYLERSICHQAIFANKNTFDNNKFDCNYKLVADRKWLFTAYSRNSYVLFCNFPICVYDGNGVSSEFNKFKSESVKLQKELYGQLGTFELMVKSVFKK